MLDLILSQNPNVTISQADEAILPPDNYHPPLCMEIGTDSEIISEGLNFQGYYRDFKSTRLPDLLHFLNQVNWDALFQNQPLDNMLNIFYEILYLGIDLYVPLKKYSTRKFPAWYSQELKNYIVEKKMAHKRFKSSNTPNDYKEFSRLRSLCKRLTQVCYRDYVHVTEETLSSNLKRF